MSSLVSSFFDWILTHLVAIAFCGFVLVGIIGREPLFGWSPSEKALSSLHEAPATLDPGAVDHMSRVEGRVDAASPTESAEQEQEVTQKISEKTPAEQAETVFRPTPDAPVSSDHQQFVPVDLAKDAKRAEGGHQASPADSIDPATLLQAARMAFWEGSMEKAEATYLRYLSERPGDADGFGELGNLYQSMGRRQDALDAYFEAGVRFKAQGQREQLLQIVELLSEAKDPRSGKLLND